MVHDNHNHRIMKFSITTYTLDNLIIGQFVPITQSGTCPEPVTYGQKKSELTVTLGLSLCTQVSTHLGIFKLAGDLITRLPWSRSQHTIVQNNSLIPGKQIPLKISSTCLDPFVELHLLH